VKDVRGIGEPVHHERTPVRRPGHVDAVPPVAVPEGSHEGPPRPPPDQREPSPYVRTETFLLTSRLSSCLLSRLPWVADADAVAVVPVTLAVGTGVDPEERVAAASLSQRSSTA